mgnify:CR=1 FL=1
MRRLADLLDEHDALTHLGELPEHARREAAGTLAEVAAGMTGRAYLKPLLRGLLARPGQLSRRLPLSRIDDCRAYLRAYTAGGHDYRPALRHCPVPITVMVGMKSPLYAPTGQMAIADYAPRFSGKIDLPEDRMLDPAPYTKARYPNLKGVIVWHVGDPATIAAARQIAAQTGAELIWADPTAVQQETLSVIRFVYKLVPQAEMKRLVDTSYSSFRGLLKKWKGQAVSAFGNGPSLAKVVEAGRDPGTPLRAVCNSTIADEAALAHLKPQLMFCGDPIQHCGVSLYAGRFRADLARAMKDPDRVVFTQLGYVPYFREVVGLDAHARVIGIGNDRRAVFNIDLNAEYLTAATANIFTMLVLPVAFTISKAVDIYGCDGMPFSAATKPWSHANEDDYMGKMSVTHRVHAGFWQRNYEEEFWSYCRDMEEILSAGEEAGIKVASRTPSFVPALAKRFRK